MVVSLSLSQGGQESEWLMNILGSNIESCVLVLMMLNSHTQLLHVLNQGENQQTFS